MNLLVTGARAPIAADLAKAFSLSGHPVWLTDSLRFPVSSASPYAKGYFRLPAPRREFKAFTRALTELCQTLSIDVIIPTSEEVFWLAGAASHLPAKTRVRTGTLEQLSQLHHKGRFAALATSLGFGAPQNLELRQPSDLAQLQEPEAWVVKPCYSRFASRILIGPTARDLDRLRPSETEPWLAQTRVKGQEYCVYNVADRGRLLLHVAYAPAMRFGVGASVYFQPVIDPNLRALSERFIAATEFTGQISFDVMVTDHGLVALECNPRGTSGVHLAAQQPETLAAALLGSALAPTPTLSPEPRLLRWPILLSHPLTLLTPSGRRRLGGAKDALVCAGISTAAQFRALAEITWRALLARKSTAATSTLDIEWNGESLAYG